VESKFPEANQKQYMVALRRIVAMSDHVVHGKNKHRFQLEKNFKSRALRRMAKGLPLKKVISTTATVDPVKKALKTKKKPAGKGKKSGEKKRKSSASRGAKAGAKGKKSGSGASKTAKDRIKEKAMANKKTEGSAATKAKVDGKRKKGDKKVEAKTKAHTNSQKKERDAK